MKAGGGLLSLQGLASSCGILEPEFEAVGTVHLLELEGGCWVIRTSKDTFEPINLSDEFRVEGISVTFEADRRPNMSSVCQVGPLIELKRIRRHEWRRE